MLPAARRVSLLRQRRHQVYQCLRAHRGLRAVLLTPQLLQHRHLLLRNRVPVPLLRTMSVSWVLLLEDCLLGWCWLKWQRSCHEMNE